MQSASPRKRRGRPPKFADVWGVGSQYNKIKEGKILTKFKEKILDEGIPKQKTSSMEKSETKPSSLRSDSSLDNDGAVQWSKGLLSGVANNTSKKEQDQQKTSLICDSLRKFFEAGGRDYNEYLKWVTAGVDMSSTSNLASQERPPPKEHRTEEVTSQNAQKSNLECDVIHILPEVDEEETCLSVYLNKLPKNPPGCLKQHETITIDPNPRRKNHNIGSAPLTVYRQCNGTFSDIKPPSIENANICVFAGCSSLNSLSRPVLPKQIHTDSTVSAVQVDGFEGQTAALDLSTKRRKLEHSHVSNSQGSCSYTNTKNKTIDENEHIIIDDRPTATLRHETGCNGVGIRSWDVEGVVDFVSSIPGCSSYGPVFLEQSIDGTTLLHLSEDHMVNYMGMKLGPAIRLKLEIDKLKFIN